jgi:integrase
VNDEVERLLLDRGVRDCQGERRRVPLRARVVEALREAGKVGPGVDPDALIFPADDGGLLDLQSWRRNYWNPAVENAGIRPHRTPYVLRHTYAAHALAAGINPYTLARRMGTSVEMIDETYGHLVADADGFERAMLDAYDERVSKPCEVEVEIEDVEAIEVAT